jgi:hypothetical protein
LLEPCCDGLFRPSPELFSLWVRSPQRIACISWWLYLSTWLPQNTTLRFQCHPPS